MTNLVGIDTILSITWSRSIQNLVIDYVYTLLSKAEVGIYMKSTYTDALAPGLKEEINLVSDHQENYGNACSY